MLMPSDWSARVTNLPTSDGVGVYKLLDRDLRELHAAYLALDECKRRPPPWSALLQTLIRAVILPLTPPSISTKLR